VVSAQTASLAPADKKLYALRDVTATVESIPLIAASIMSKKIASGAGNILLDVKCGNGAFMEDIAKADELAKLMSDVGKLAGRNIKVFVTNMDQPLGNYIGNALEVKEAYDTLDGKGPKDLTDLCVMLSAGMMELAGIGSYEDCVVKAYESIENKIALLQFRKALEAQGGKFDESGYPVLHNKAIYTRDVFAQSNGFISNMDTKAIGMASLVLGAGRARKEDIIDPGAGIILYKKIPDSVKAGDRIAALFTNKEASLEEAESIMKKSIHIGTAQADELKLVLEVID
jgi:pyrimidine-nucleoside phosphorylase